MPFLQVVTAVRRKLNRTTLAVAVIYLVAAKFGLTPSDRAKLRVGPSVSKPKVESRKRG